MLRERNRRRGKEIAMGVRMLLLAAVISAVVGSGCTLAGPAQDVLGDLAQSERAARRTAGFTTLGIGVAIGIVSVAVMLDSGIGIYGVIAGGLIALPGVAMLAIPSEAEREFAQAGGVETSSALALERLSEKGRRSRILPGVVNLAAGIASLLYPYSYFTPYDYIYSAISSFGTAAVDFLLSSKEEQAFA